MSVNERGERRGNVNDDYLLAVIDESLIILPMTKVHKYQSHPFDVTFSPHSFPLSDQSLIKEESFIRK